MLAETYEEAKKVEAKRESIEDYLEWSREKNVGRKDLLFSKPKDEQSPYFEQNHRLGKGEGSPKFLQALLQEKGR